MTTSNELEVAPLVTITVSIARNGDVTEDTQCHGNRWADVYRGIHAVRARIEELIAGRRECPFNPSFTAQQGGGESP